MKKIYLALIIFLYLALPIIGFAQGGGACGGPIVTCDGSTGNPCDFNALMQMIGRIYSFIVQCIATPLAVIAVTVGGILMLVSAGNPNLLSLGKKVFYSALIGLALAYLSYTIVKFVLDAIGYQMQGGGI